MTVAIRERIVQRLASAAVTLDIVGQVRASRWSMEPTKELAGDEGRIAVLDIGAVVHRAHAKS